MVDLMKSVSLICTVHAERGRANASELHAILGRIRPEVIFVEAPATWGQARLAMENPNRLETMAILRYQESQSAVVVPVDLPIPPESFFRHAAQLFSYIERVSDKYCRLMDQNEKSIILEGFYYLNGAPHEKMQSEIHDEVLQIIEMRGDPSLAQTYNAWRHQNDMRDIEMISNIERYGRENIFNRSAFLIGAAHRQSIIRKLEGRLSSAPTDVQWDYSSRWAT